LFSIIYFGRELVLKLYLTDDSAPALRELAYRGLRIYPLGLLVFGYNVFVQEFMNVVGNNKVSLTLSLIENFLFSNLFMLLLPRLFGTDGVWFTFLAAELSTIFFTIYVVYAHRNVYGYGSKGIATFVNE